MTRQLRAHASPTTPWAGLNAFEGTGHIEDTVRLLGLRFLDRAAAVIGHHWRRQSETEDGSVAEALGA
ncbi:hypothetical protein [Streptomyces syringium]|uniref:hypothetical protein n=1 Tax=Streptomyces syringium TaxID=76729 RepID=UPI003455D282